MSDSFFHPPPASDLPRFAGVATFMRLPHVPPGHARFGDVDVGLIGVPWDSGTSNRPGARHGPRQVRDASTMMRAQNGATGIRPFEALNCADLGDVPPNPVDLDDSMTRITDFYIATLDAGITPLTAGGDHLSTLPILRAVAARRPVGLIQFDSHTDLTDSYFGGQKYTHGTPFRRAIEEGLIDPRRMVQIGIRGTMYDTEDRDFADANGIRLIPVEEFHARGPANVMAEARQIAGSGPTYITYDIDFVDPAFAPGTGTPEVGGPNSHQALEVVRGLAGLDIVGADMVEVSPPFDASGGTALLGATILFELLCVMAADNG
ncbi:agmatinase [Roseovarius sp. M141]|uniref:agmatinase n=1 Tax=Roseovarius sp. M141 TaxID=2583806 RepID=UPI0020CD29B2|nr:agmatinase [Roseovarius sp. M141]MCQ0092177.1 agmatinase [Roseovarius sp. M141]